MLLIICQLSRGVIAYEDLQSVIGAFRSVYCLQSSIVNQIVNSPVVLSQLVLLDHVNKSFIRCCNYWLPFSGVCSKLVNQLSKAQR